MLPSVTLIAVSSSIAYAGTCRPAAHFSAWAIVLWGNSSWSRCGKIEKSTTPVSYTHLTLPTILRV